MAREHMHLAFSAHLSGAHQGSWRDRATREGADVDVRSFHEIAQIAERGLFDLVFVADSPAVRSEPREVYSRIQHFTNVLEPLTALTAMAAVTSRIGLGGTASTSFYEPFNVGRLFASLDHISGGRAAWNVVTTATDFAAKNFGLDRMPAHADRYRRAREFIEVVLGFWGTWEDGAFLYDKEGGRLFDPDKLHPLEYSGEFFQIKGGALNLEPTPQGRPVVIQAGASEAGKALAAETADVVFGVGKDIATAKAFYDDVKGRLRSFGRGESSLKILSGVSLIVKPTKAEAEDTLARLDGLVHDDVLRQGVAMDLETDLSHLSLDDHVPASILPKQGNLHTEYFNTLVTAIREKNPTLRELGRMNHRGNDTLLGTPQQIADELEERFAAKSADGFMFQFPLQPEGLSDFVELVVPELQRRGLFRTAYAGATLRDHLELPHLSPRAQTDSAGA